MHSNHWLTRTQADAAWFYRVLRPAPACDPYPRRQMLRFMMHWGQVLSSVAADTGCGASIILCDSG